MPTDDNVIGIYLYSATHNFEQLNKQLREIHRCFSQDYVLDRAIVYSDGTKHRSSFQTLCDTNFNHINTLLLSSPDRLSRKLVETELRLKQLLAESITVRCSDYP